MTMKNDFTSEGYKVCRYFTPASLTASQTAENKGARARKKKMEAPLTYKILIENQERKVLLENINPQTAANRATALRGFLKANGLVVDDIVGDEMRIHHPEAMERFIRNLQDDNKSPRAISNTRSAFKSWKESVVEYDTIQAINAEKPTPFVQIITSLLKDLLPTRVAKAAGIPKDMLFGWLRGKIPRSSNCKYILRLEVYFALEQYSLVQLSGMKLKGIRKEPLGGKPAPIEYRNVLGKLTSITFALKPDHDSPLREQWKDFLAYKTAAKPKYKRTKLGKWRISPCPLTCETEKTWWAFFEGREVASAKFFWTKLTGYLGWLNSSVDAGGKGIPAKQLQTLAWLVVPDYVEAFMDWTKDRIGARNRGAIQFLAMIAAVVRPRHGYLRQRPELAATLPSEYRHMEWEELCDKQFDLVEYLMDSYTDELEVSRDSFEPIKHLMQMPQPMHALADMIQRMRADRPIGSPRLEAVWSRDLVLIKLLISNPLRRRNLAHMTWRADNTGDLYQRVDKSWWIKISKRKFKNSNGAAGQRDYDSPVHPSAWPDIEKYLLIHRPRLLSSPSDLVFLTSKNAQNNKKHVPWADLSKRVTELTIKYLPQCLGIGSHAFRHLVATSILKADGGDLKTAALVLNDRVTTVERHYAWLQSGDGAKRMAELLDSSFKRM